MRLQIDEGVPQETPAVFIERCQSLGFSVWRLDVNGMAVSDPRAPAAIRMWLSSPVVRRLLVECAEYWSTMDEPGACEPSPGLWVQPVPVEHRGRRIGFCVLVGFTSKVLGTDILREGVDGDPLALAALSHTIGGVVQPWDTIGETAQLLLRWVHEDQRAMQELEQSIETCTDQLSESYETLTAMHILGREMGSVDDPRSFVEQTLELISVTINFRWAGCVLSDGAPIEGDRVVQSGDLEIEPERVQELLRMIESSEPIAVSDETTVYDSMGVLPELEPQVIRHPIRARGTHFGWLVIGGKRGEDSYVSSHDTKTLDSISGILASFLENAMLYEEQRAMFIGTVNALSNAIDAKDPYTQGHSERVAMLSEALARSLGYDDEAAQRVRLCGILHDIGKIGVPESVLCKDGRLTDEEFGLIKKHPTIGARMLEGIPSLSDIIPGVEHHHERWDGGGYPAGLSGENIPEIARILALADTFDAMSSNRAYRDAMPREKVFAEFERCSGSQFDPAMVAPFLALDFGAYDAAVSRAKAQTKIRAAA